MNTQRVRIRTTPADPPTYRYVQGYVFGDFAAHEPTAGDLARGVKGWSVTHRPSGYRIPCLGYLTKADAILAAHALDESGIVSDLNQVGQQAPPYGPLPPHLKDAPHVVFAIVAESRHDHAEIVDLAVLK